MNDSSHSKDAMAERIRYYGLILADKAASHFRCSVTNDEKLNAEKEFTARTEQLSDDLFKVPQELFDEFILFEMNGKNLWWENIYPSTTQLLNLKINEICENEKYYNDDLVFINSNALNGLEVKCNSNSGNIFQKLLSIFIDAPDLDKKISLSENNLDLISQHDNKESTLNVSEQPISLKDLLCIMNSNVKEMDEIIEFSDFYSVEREHLHGYEELSISQTDHEKPSWVANMFYGNITDSPEANSNYYARDNLKYGLQSSSFVENIKAEDEISSFIYNEPRSSFDGETSLDINSIELTKECCNGKFITQAMDLPKCLNDEKAWRQNAKICEYNKTVEKDELILHRRKLGLPIRLNIDSTVNGQKNLNDLSQCCSEKIINEISDNETTYNRRDQFQTDNVKDNSVSEELKMNNHLQSNKIMETNPADKRQLQCNNNGNSIDEKLFINYQLQSDSEIVTERNLVDQKVKTGQHSQQSNEKGIIENSICQNENMSYQLEPNIEKLIKEEFNLCEQSLSKRISGDGKEVLTNNLNSAQERINNKLKPDNDEKINNDLIKEQSNKNNQSLSNPNRIEDRQNTNNEIKSEIKTKGKDVSLSESQSMNKLFEDDSEKFIKEDFIGEEKIRNQVRSDRASVTEEISFLRQESINERLQTSVDNEIKDDTLHAQETTADALSSDIENAIKHDSISASQRLEENVQSDLMNGIKECSAGVTLNLSEKSQSELKSKIGKHSAELTQSVSEQFQSDIENIIKIDSFQKPQSKSEQLPEDIINQIERPCNISEQLQSDIEDAIKDDTLKEQQSKSEIMQTDFKKVLGKCTAGSTQSLTEQLQSDIESVIKDDSCHKTRSKSEKLPKNIMSLTDLPCNINEQLQSEIENVIKDDIFQEPQNISDILQTDIKAAMGKRSPSSTQNISEQLQSDIENMLKDDFFEEPLSIRETFQPDNKNSAEKKSTGTVQSTSKRLQLEIDSVIKDDTFHNSQSIGEQLQTDIDNIMQTKSENNTSEKRSKPLHSDTENVKALNIPTKSIKRQLESIFGEETVENSAWSHQNLNKKLQTKIENLMNNLQINEKEVTKYQLPSDFMKVINSTCEVKDADSNVQSNIKKLIYEDLIHAKNSSIQLHANVGNTTNKNLIFAPKTSKQVQSNIDNVISNNSICAQENVENKSRYKTATNYHLKSSGKKITKTNSISKKQSNKDSKKVFNDISIHHQQTPDDQLQLIAYDEKLKVVPQTEKQKDDSIPDQASTVSVKSDANNHNFNFNFKIQFHIVPENNTIDKIKIFDNPIESRSMNGSSKIVDTLPGVNLEEEDNLQSKKAGEMNTKKSEINALKAIKIESSPFGCTDNNLKNVLMKSKECKDLGKIKLFNNKKIHPVCNKEIVLNKAKIKNKQKFKHLSAVRKSVEQIIKNNVNSKKELETEESKPFRYLNNKFIQHFIINHNNELEFFNNCNFISKNSMEDLLYARLINPKDTTGLTRIQLSSEFNEPTKFSNSQRMVRNFNQKCVSKLDSKSDTFIPINKNSLNISSSKLYRIPRNLSSLQTNYSQNITSELKLRKPLHSQKKLLSTVSQTNFSEQNCTNSIRSSNNTCSCEKCPIYPSPSSMVSRIEQPTKTATGKPHLKLNIQSNDQKEPPEEDCKDTNLFAVLSPIRRRIIRKLAKLGKVRALACNNIQQINENNDATCKCDHDISKADPCDNNKPKCTTKKKCIENKQLKYSLVHTNHKKQPIFRCPKPVPKEDGCPSVGEQLKSSAYKVKNIVERKMILLNDIGKKSLRLLCQKQDDKPKKLEPTLLEKLQEKKRKQLLNIKASKINKNENVHQCQRASYGDKLTTSFKQH